MSDADGKKPDAPETPDAAEAAVALALAVLDYRRRETVDLDRITSMRW